MPGRQVVVEELLTGPEVSVFGLSDGRNVRTLVPARDHKRIFDGDRGPNTGGMGAIAPPPDAGVDDVLEEVSRTVLEPCIDALREQGTPFVGCLYAGLMLTPDGLRVLEFNARFGDPETQVVLPLLDESLLDLLTACARGEVDGRHRAASRRAPRSAWSRRPPGTPATCAAATSSPASRRSTPTCSAFTPEPRGTLTARCGPPAAGCSASPRSRADVEAARARAYGNLARVHFDGMQARTDIGRSGRPPGARS